MSCSGLHINKNITVFAGVIDNDHRVVILLIVHNYGCQDFLAAKGMRMVQLVIQKIVDPFWIEVEELDKTESGDKVSGSTGLVG